MSQNGQHKPGETKAKFPLAKWVAKSTTSYPMLKSLCKRITTKPSKADRMSNCNGTCEACDCKHKSNSPPLEGYSSGKVGKTNLPEPSRRRTDEVNLKL